MEKSIYDVYVTVTSQEQADRLKGICLEYGLPIWEAKCAFEFVSHLQNYFEFYKLDKEFFVRCTLENRSKHKQITESDFIQLAKEFKQ